MTIDIIWNANIRLDIIQEELNFLKRAEPKCLKSLLVRK